jgi:carboxyl-terminal processing protease
VLQDVPEELKARTDTRGEASLRGHLKSEGDGFKTRRRSRAL